MKIAFVNLIHTRQKLAHLSEQAINWILPRYCAGCSKENEVFCEKCADASYKRGAQCLICGFRNNDGKICGWCFKKAGLETNSQLHKVLWAGHYDGALREAIWQFKYKKRKELAAPLAEMLWKKFCEIKSLPVSQNFSRHEYSPAGEFLCSSRHGVTAQGLEKFSPPATSTALPIIIPIPLHFKKEYERGFNQAEILAKEFSVLSHFTLLANSLIKIKETKAQVEVENKESRISNLENAFQVNPKISKSDMQLLTSGTLILIDDVATTGATLIHASRALAKAGLSADKAGAKKIIGLVLAHGG